MKKILACIAFAVMLVLCGCAQAQTQEGIAHRYATASKGKELLLSNDAYYAGFSQNDLDFRMQKTGATMEEYKAFVAEQVLDFTDEEKALVDKRLQKMENTLKEGGYTLPDLDSSTA